jgi:glucose/arabinose dehydrogenase
VRRRGARWRAAVAALVTALAAVGVLGEAPSAGAATLPANFEAQTVFSGITNPVVFRFTPDGQVFVATKSGKIWLYENVHDPTPTLFANLAKPVYDYEDHGLLGLAIDPGFEIGRPYVYALYTFNHALTDKYTQFPHVTDPKAEPLAWPEYKGPAGSFEEDKCPEGEKVKKKEIPEELEGCEVSGLLVRLTDENGHAAPSATAPEEEVLLEGWCQQSTTHAPGDLGFGPEGALFVSGGEGAMFSKPDYGQFENVCEDPPEPGHAILDRLNALGGSLRSQSVLRDHSLGPEYATLLSGSVLRVDPNTGEGWPGNPFLTGPKTELNARRIYAFGYRNPWRFAVTPRLGSIFLSNVGNGHYEEMDRIPLASGPLTPAAAFNSGWPCYEGGQNGVSVRNYEYAGEFEGHPDPSIQACIDFYEAEDEGKPQTRPPFYAYVNGGPAVPGDPCPGKPTDIGGLAFYEGSEYPAAYDKALFFADPIRGCIYVMQAKSDGEPNTATATTFLSEPGKFTFPGVDIEQGPEGDIYFAEFGSGGNGAIKRIVYDKPEEESGGGGGGGGNNGGGGNGNGGNNGGGNPPPPPTYTPPKIQKRPKKTTTSRTAKFVFKGEPGLRYRCKLDGKKFASCSSPRTYKKLGLGKHSFRVYAVDAAGTRLTANTTFSWKIVKR